MRKPKPTAETIKQLATLLNWAIGNGSRREGNPYLIPEVKAALQHLADLTGIKDKLNVELPPLMQ